MAGMSIRTIEVTTADGTCPVFLHRPAGRGPWPGILFYMDGPGIWVEAEHHWQTLIPLLDGVLKQSD